MSNVNINGVQQNPIDLVKPQGSQAGGVACVDTLYASIFKEADRTTVSQSFTPISLEQAPQGAKFCNALVDNQESLMQRMGISEDEYNYYAAVALALSTQETGMGFEEGYNEENTGIDGWVRSHGKMFLSWFGEDSASSGLTQMKIHDFLNGDTLTQEEKRILADYGIKSNSGGHNNLYDEPDKAAIATMVVLNAIQRQIDDYHGQLTSYHEDLSQSMDDGLTEEERNAKGEEILDSICAKYEQAQTPLEKELIRETFRNWFIAIPDGKDELNEAFQLENLQKLVGFDIKQEDLDYVRYFLTSPGQQMDRTEALAYLWNKGYTNDSMKMDRLCAYKIGTLMTSPDDLGYYQFPVNVSKFAQMYYTDMYDG